MISTRNKPASSTFIGSMKQTQRAAAGEWEMRPGGMLVQKRGPDSEQAIVAAAAATVPTIRVKVKHESAYYEIYIGSQSTFGELKKLLAERTGVHHRDQRILYKDRERESGSFLDACGVRDKSKLAMALDPAAHATRLLETRRAARLEKAASAVKGVAAEVNRLALLVSEMEAAVREGGEVADKDVSNLTEQLMMQLIKLDGVVADGDIKLQRETQARRAQKYVETLDMLKMRNARIAATTSMHLHHRQPQQQSRKRPAAAAAAASVVVTTEWEMFDSPASTTTSSSTTSSSIAPTSSQWLLL